jgi:hypothetical protein
MRANGGIMPADNPKYEFKALSILVSNMFAPDGVAWQLEDFVNKEGWEIVCVYPMAQNYEYHRVNAILKRQKHEAH